MEHLTGINIRSAVEELSLPIKEIFKINTGVEGDKRIKELCLEGNKKTFVKYPDLQNVIIDSKHELFFSEKKTAHKLNDTLVAYIFDYYYAYQDMDKNNKIICEKTSEVQFVNTEILEFDEYCFNLMTAQAFTGNFNSPDYLYPFFGIGSFDLSEYANVHQMIMNSNCNMNYFFVYYKKILASINSFISAGYESDIKSQRKYLTDSEYKSVMRTLKSHKKMISAQFEQWKSIDKDSDPEDDE